MQFAAQYLEKNKGAFCFLPPDLTAMGIIVVIPCRNEPDIEMTINSLYQCHHPGTDVGIVVVINSDERSCVDTLSQNEKTRDDLSLLANISPGWLHLFTLYIPNLPYKHAGAGWARKIGMDWATGHFNKAGNPDGLIVSLDADTLVENNYLTSIVNAFRENPSAIGGTLYFEHPAEEEQTREAIARYELYMRYYRHSLAWSGFPHAHYALGSCFTVKARAYVSQGGMNRLKAGEDFYFLQKLIPYGKLIEINSTTVYPSARISERVPFGTGPAMKKIISGDSVFHFTYSIDSFQVLKDFFQSVDTFYEKQDSLTLDDLSANPVFITFCRDQNLIDELILLSSNCGAKEIFVKRFFHIFNAFRVLKWLNFAVNNGFLKKKLTLESVRLLTILGVKTDKLPLEPVKILEHFRRLDKNRQAMTSVIIIE